MFFLQMSGVPGSGKSTLAKALSKNTGAVVVDHDVIKSALLGAWEAEVDTRLAGKIAYDIEWALIDFHLSQGFSVILDSPCLYAVMIEKGMALTEKHQAVYKYVECVLEEIGEIDRRLKTRPRMLSQNGEVTSEEAFKKAFARSVRPTTVPYLIVDSARPLEKYFDEVVEYLKR